MASRIPGIAAATLALPVLALLASPGTAQTPEPATWHAEAITYGEGGSFAITYFWSKGPKLRATTMVRGRPVLTLVSGDWYYAIDEMGARGLAIQRSPKAVAADAKGERPFANEGKRLLEQGAERIRTEQLSGSPVDVYRLTDGAARRELWIGRKGAQLPLRMEVFSRTTGMRRRTDYLGWSRELSIPDSFFEPDPRVTLERLTHDQYLKRVSAGKVGPVPVLYGTLLHGDR